MRVFLTGATGFLGSGITRALRDRGDEVVAYVRNAGKASDLGALGCDVVVGDLLDTAAVAAAMDGCDAAIHCAGVYEVGVMPSRRPVLYEGNVTATERVLDAAAQAALGRIVYVSTVNAAGNTGGEVADETTVHHGNYVSYYDETKHRAHQIAEARIAAGLPCIIVMPSAVYGPGDQSQIGVAIDLYLKRRMPAVVFAETGLSFVYRDDAVAGIVAAMDRGRTGESYILSGENGTTRDLIDTLADLTGRRRPRLDLPTGVLRAIAPLGPAIGPPMGLAPNLREVISAADGVTYWGRHDKATAELDYRPRPLKEGLRETLQQQGHN